MKKLSTLLFWILLGLSLGGCQDKNQAPAPSADLTPEQTLVAGQIKLSPALKSEADPLAVLFIIARSPQGPIVAVKKLLPPLQYPLAFQLTSNDQMIPGRKLPKELRLKVRLDQDGDANPDQSGDIVGQTEDKLIPTGSKEVQIILDKKIK